MKVTTNNLLFDILDNLETSYTVLFNNVQEKNKLNTGKLKLNETNSDLNKIQTICK